MIQSTIFMTQNTPFVNPMTETTLLTIENIMKYALGEHDPGSA